MLQYVHLGIEIAHHSQRTKTTREMSVQKQQRTQLLQQQLGTEA
jgi:hypothetical protein